MTGYAELQVTSNFSFLRGASHPEELVLQAHALGLDAIALTDRNSLAGVVRAHSAAREVGMRLVVGARLDLLPEGAPLPRRDRTAGTPFDRVDALPPAVAGAVPPPGRENGGRGHLRLVDDAPAEAVAGGFSLLCLPTDRAAYGRLSQLVSLGQRRVEKGLAALWLDDVLAHAEGQVLIALPPPDPDAPGFDRFLDALRAAAPDRSHLAAQFLHQGDDRARIGRLAELAGRHRVPLVATGDVLYHTPARRPLQDVLSCIREKCTIDEAGLRLHANAERHLKPAAEIRRLFRDWPDAVARTVGIVDACRFSLDELRYDYPIDAPPDGLTVQSWLERLAIEGARERYPDGIPARVEALLRHEFALIEELGYAPYFLTVYDIVRFARSRGILCQGRGSAANSAVCYCLGVTAVDPGRFDLLFERFVSAERGEPPDIDVDFEHERREEVIQYVYGKYGREHAGIAATVIHYRTRSAIREVGKALGLSADVVGGLAGSIWGWSEEGVAKRDLEERGMDPDEPRVALAVRLSRELIGFPRHLSQHVGGFVLTRSRLDQVVPVVNGAMPDRTFVEWDKDDLDALGILKIDVLGLGMLTCVRKAFDLLASRYGTSFDLATVPPEDPAVYEMLGRGDSVGVFQVESRAQMTMLPRLRPNCFYDLIVEVAIVRPGPIQGDMVHPYLRRRAGLEPVDYPSDELKDVLEKTLGVPLFQEQAMKIAIIAAGFTPSESDRLRRAMATFKRVGTIDRLGTRFIEGMVQNGYARDFAEKCFKQIEGFGTYGFPESHAASFALLVYVSSWIKCHFPEVFAAALLNSQPMGFYAPAQIVRDARDHGVTVLPVDVNASDWDATLEPPPAAADVSMSSGAVALTSPDRGPTPPPAADADVSMSSGAIALTSPGLGLTPPAADADVSMSSDAIARTSPDRGPTPPAADADVSMSSGAIARTSPGRGPTPPAADADVSMSSGTIARTSPDRGPAPPAADAYVSMSSGALADGFPGSHGPRSASPVEVKKGLTDQHPAGCRTRCETPPQRVTDVQAGERSPLRGTGSATDQGLVVSAFATTPCTSHPVPAPPRGSIGFPSPASDSAGALNPSSTSLSHPPVHARGYGGNPPARSGAAPSAGLPGSHGPGSDCRGGVDKRLTPSPMPIRVACAEVPRFALRLGFRQVKGLQEEEMRRLVACRGDGYTDLAGLRRRARTSQGALDRLARADAFGSLTLDRRQAVWTAIGLDGTGQELDRPPLLDWADGAAARAEPAVGLPGMSTGQHVAEDYRTLRLTLRSHPLALLRPRLSRRTVRAADLRTVDDGRWITAAGLVLVRQRPGTASGVIFITLEDETGVINLVVWPKVFERFRRVVLGAQMMSVTGKVQKDGLVIHVVASRLDDRTDLLRDLGRSEIDAPVARADRVKRGAARRSPRKKSGDDGSFAAPLAHADGAKNPAGPDPRDPLWRPRDIDHYRSHPDLFPAPLARADEVRRNTRNTQPSPDEHRHPHRAAKLQGFKSRDFH